MSKISDDAAHAFIIGESFKKSNTRVFKDAGEWKMSLHDNVIAKRSPAGTFLSNCGWTTPTTKSRLNAIIDELPGIQRIYQKDFIWYWKNGVEFNDGWNQVKK